ncbi:unnamed protein product [Dicrocoelium dendriticum]|nr:unnamed protein product [Dicrocoelium dendriticum]
MVQCLLVGIRDDKARERLLVENEKKLTWETACALVRKRERVAQHVSNYRGDSHSGAVHAAKSGLSLTNKYFFTCHRCGEKHEKVTDCRHSLLVTSAERMGILHAYVVRPGFNDRYPTPPRVLFELRRTLTIPYFI